MSGERRLVMRCTSYDEQGGFTCSHVYTPTPADLLTDPRVRALVEAAGTVVQYSEIAGDVDWNRLIDALAPFEVSDVE
jgi:hypothetical protein